MRESAQTSEPAPMRNIERILISSADHERLKRLVPDQNMPQKVVWRRGSCVGQRWADVLPMPRRAACEGHVPKLSPKLTCR